MRLSTYPIPFILAALSFVACDSESPAETACKRVEACGLLDEGDSIEECVKDAEEDIPAGKLEDCANCLEEHSCSEISDDEVCEEICDD